MAAENRDKVYCPQSIPDSNSESFLPRKSSTSSPLPVNCQKKISDGHLNKTGFAVSASWNHTVITHGGGNGKIFTFFQETKDDYDHTTSMRRGIFQSRYERNCVRGQVFPNSVFVEDSKFVLLANVFDCAYSKKITIIIINRSQNGSINPKSHVDYLTDYVRLMCPLKKNFAFPNK